VHGLDGDAVVQADFAARRRWAKRLLALDVLDLRHKLPRDAYVQLHALARRLAYPLITVLGRRHAAMPAITADRFALTAAIDPSTLVLFAVATKARSGP
jgi:hypothetical protein